MKQNLYYHKFHLPAKVFLIKTAIILLTACAAFAQTAIKGKVTDATTKESIPGVTIMVKGAKTVAATDVNGNYFISAPASATLVFRYVGYDLQEVAVNSQTTINIQLAPTTKELKDVVITALNQSKEKRAVGYSVSEVKGASLTEARENTFVNSLEGRVAGVSVSGVATGPNGASNVVIRGITNMTGNNQPLYVLNGIPLINNNYATTDVQGGYGGKDGGDGIGDINPDDIETISILKGAAATALYGYRGANGVVLITTKKGKAGEGLGVEINSNYVKEDVIDETDFQTVYGQGYNGAKPVSAADALGSMESSWGAKLDGSDTYQFDGVKRPYSAVAKGNLNRFYGAGGNFTNTFSFSKGFEDGGATRFSFSYLHDNSYVPNAGLQRLTFNQYTNLKLGKNLTLDLSSQYVSEYTKNAPNVSDAVGNLNWGPMFVPANINIKTLAGPNGNGTVAGDSGLELNPFSDPYTTNPYFAAYELQGAIHRNRFIGSANLKYTFDSGYFVGLQVADDYTNDRNTNIEPAGTGYLVDQGIGGDMFEQNTKQTELNIDLTAGKKFKITKDLSFNVLLGGNYRKSTQEYLNAGGYNFAIPFLYTITNLETPQESHVLNNEEYQSIYGSGDISYKNFLYLTVTGRNDWYSTLSPGKINYLYPSFSGSFVFSELLHIPAMDLGKLRLSYADVGGAADAPYQTLQTYGIQGTLITPNGGTYPIGSAGNGTVPNSALRPSSRKEFEAGTEMDFFHNRLKFDLAVYQKKVIGDIVPVTIDYTSGYTSALLNVGTLRYNGVELEIGGTPLKSSKFSWDVNLNATYSKGKVLSLGDQQQITLGSEAQDWGSLSYTQQIVGKEPLQIIAYTPARDAQGNIIIDPALGAPDPSQATPKDYGSGENPWAAGINNTFRYSGFRLSFLIDGKFGGKIFSNTNIIAYQQGLSKLTVPGRDKLYGTDQQYASGYYNDWAFADQGQFVYSDSFIKFRQLIVGYDFPAKMFNNKIHGLSLSFVCHNVFTIMKHTPNIDPESSYSASIYSAGLEAPAVPYSRTLGFNLNIKL
ncbi:MAG: SusC/RagA family TonB-linked outer membrane protein [Bacteroidetes bacterium]|jgi:TonB-linked SusC/RagA family outer membrane protein|nr:SusC/RagA family TonB-linked outer membrane protein [Bacteroidota bacterium]